VTTASCQQRWWTNWIHLHLYLAAEQRTLGCLVTTNHNKAVRGLVSQPITANVGHLTWQLSMATLLMASADPEALSALEVFFTTMRYINLPHFTFEECYVGKYKNTHRCCRWLKMFCCIIIAACVIGICVFFQQSVKINSTVDGVEAFVNSSSSPVLWDTRQVVQDAVQVDIVLFVVTEYRWWHWRCLLTESALTYNLSASACHLTSFAL